MHRAYFNDRMCEGDTLVESPHLLRNVLRGTISKEPASIPQYV